MAQSIVQSFEDYYVGEGHNADTLSAVKTSDLENLADRLKAFTDAAREASEAERGVMSSLHDQAIASKMFFYL